MARRFRTLRQRVSPDWVHTAKVPLSGDDRLPTPRALYAVHVTVCVGVALIAVLQPLRAVPTWPPRAAVLGCLAVLLAAHLAGFSFGGGRFRVPSLALQALLGFLPLVWFGASWGVLSSFLAGSLLLVVKPLLALPACACVLLAAGVVSAQAAVSGVPVLDGFAGAVFTALAALAIFTPIWLAELAEQREDVRQDLVERAIAKERQRFSRDTHDLLGLSLSAITLKGELTTRLAADCPGRVKEELSEIVVMSRQALADVRAVAAGYRNDLSLEEEYRTAAAVLRSAGVEVVMDHRPADLSAPVASTLATVLREGVTNVVRHSEARWCEVSMHTSDGTASLVVVNDGVPEAPGSGAARPPGAGLRNLRYRVGQLGGELTAEVRPDGTHRLCARVPRQ